MQEKLKTCFNKLYSLKKPLLIFIIIIPFYTGYAQTNNDCPFCYLRNKNFAGQDLTNANFNGADLDSADFSNAKLSGANFSNASLTGAKFINATASVTGNGAVNFSLSNLTGANFSSSNLDSAIFYYAVLSCTNFSNATLTSAQMGADVKVHNGCAANFKGAKLGCSFTPFITILNLADATLPPCYEKVISDSLKWLSEQFTRSAALPGDTLFVAETSGRDNNSCGAVNNPCKTINQAVTNCKGKTGCTVAVEFGEYLLTTSLQLNSVNLIGGYYKGQPTTYQSLLKAPPKGKPAITVTSGKVQISNFIINGSSSTAWGASSTAVLALSNSELVMHNIKVNSAVGGRGGKGNDAIQGTNGNPGDKGTLSRGGRGGLSPCNNNNGGGGGDASVVVGYACTAHWSGCDTIEVRVNWKYSKSGQPGSTGVSANGGRTGGITTTWSCTPGTRPAKITATIGDPGKAGGCGMRGYVNDTTTGTFKNSSWVANLGGPGSPGGNGGGGGGGGGAAGCVNCHCACHSDVTVGTGGGGGGSGGCLALGGRGGGMGGASFSIVLINARLVCDATVSLTNGAGGEGGRGGNGASGGVGGHGGPPAPAGKDCETYAKEGGPGGPGGASGGGAGGNGGPSIGIALVGSSTLTGNPVYYPGSSGKPGTGGTGGTPAPDAKCHGIDGDKGNTGLVATVFKF